MIDFESALVKVASKTANKIKDYIDKKVTYITPQMYGAKGDGITDDTDAIQTMFNTAKNNSVIYFPSGKYRITKGLIIKEKSFAIKGSSKHATSLVHNWSDETKNTYAKSTLYLDCKESDSNITLLTITGATTNSAVNIENMGFSSNSYGNFVENAPVAGKIVPAYSFTTYNEKINGVVVDTDKLKNTIVDMSYCSFSGFSGYAIKASKVCRLSHIYTNNCWTSVKLITDGTITDSLFTMGYRAIELGTGINKVLNQWIDLMADCAIIGNQPLIFSGNIDHIGKQIIRGVSLKSDGMESAEICTMLNLSGRFNRWGGNYRNWSFDDINAISDANEKQEALKCVSMIYGYGLNNSIINITGSNNGNWSDSGTVITGSAFNLHYGNELCNNTIVLGQEFKHIFYTGASWGRVGNNKITMCGSDFSTTGDYKAIEKSNSLIDLFGISGYVNVKAWGLDNTYTNDNADKLQALINTVSNGSTLYFPRGKYKLSHGVTVNKNLAFVGECMPKNLAFTDDGKYYGSFLVFDDNTENDTMITQGTSSWHMPIENIGFVAHSYKWTDNGINDSESPYEEYTVETIKENVNAVYYKNTGSVPKDCIFSGFSGYGIRTTQAQNLNNVHFRHCNQAILQETNDLMLHGGYITQCKTGIYMTKGNIFIDGTYIDLIAQHAIDCQTYLSGKLDVYIDHTGFSGIYAKGFNHVSGNVKLGRTGMYYGGKTIDDLKVSSSGAEELENFKKASGICTDIVQDTTLTVEANPRNVSDDASSTKETPILGFYTQKAFGAVLTGANLSVLLRWQTDEKTNMTVITDKGITRYTKGKTIDL